MILVIDNYDSFVYNLVCYLHNLGFQTQVYRNNKIELNMIAALNVSHIVISPGPGWPAQAGVCVPLIQVLGGQVPILGVCLGHQAIVEAYGGKIIHAKKPMHGMSSLITHNETGLFAGCQNPLRVARYHSLVADLACLPDCLQVTATSDDGEIMAVSHKAYPVYGVQFHPESVLTQGGHDLLRNFLAGQAFEIH